MTPKPSMRGFVIGIALAVPLWLGFFILLWLFSH